MTTTKIMQIFFTQYVDGGMIGLDGIPEKDHPSDRELAKLLKAHARTLTTNRITQWDHDGYTLYFKEVVEIPFEHHSGCPLYDHEETWYARPIYLPDQSECSHMQIKKS